MLDLGSAVYCRIAFTALGVSDGFACSIKATVPATIGAAMLVPVRLRYGWLTVGTLPQSRPCGLRAKSALAASAIASTATPGATRSGFAAPSIAEGPRELNAATASSLRSAVPRVSAAPTVSTQGALPGAVIPPY